MSKEIRFQEASLKADAARERLIESAHRAKARIAPRELATDARIKICQGVRNSACRAKARMRDRPIPTGAAIGALMIYIFRRPLWALLRGRRVNDNERKTHGSETHHG